MPRHAIYIRFKKFRISPMCKKTLSILRSWIHFLKPFSKTTSLNLTYLSTFITAVPFLCSSSEVNFFSSIAWCLFLFSWLPEPIIASIVAFVALRFGLGVALSWRTLVKESSDVAPEPPVRALLRGLSGGEMHWLWPLITGCSYLAEDSTSNIVCCYCWCAAYYLSICD